MSSTAKRPRVLFVFYSYTGQTRAVVDAMTQVLRGRGCDVSEAVIEFTDPRYTERFAHFPLRHAYMDILGMLPAQVRRATGAIRIPDGARERGYDLVCVGSPTWWLTTSMPIRSFLKSDAADALLGGTRFAAFVSCRRYWRGNLESMRKLGSERGGAYVGGIHFAAAGGQVRSLLSLVSYLATGENRERYLGVSIPRAGMTPDYGQRAREFADGLADALDPSGSPG